MPLNALNPVDLGFCPYLGGCSVVPLIVCGHSVFGPCFLFSVFFIFLFYNHLDRERRSGCFTMSSCGVL